MTSKTKCVSILFVFIYKFFSTGYKIVYYYFMPAALVLMVFAFGRQLPIEEDD